jgi:hypothetical protein
MMLLVGWRFFVAALATVPLVLLDGTGFRRALAPPGLTLRAAAAVTLIGTQQTAAVTGSCSLRCAPSRPPPPPSCCSIRGPGTPEPRMAP